MNDLPQTHLASIDHALDGAESSIPDVRTVVHLHGQKVLGDMLHVLSTYEVRHAAADSKPFVRGLNSFQLLQNGNRWWIFSIEWQPETSQLKLPEKYL